jgi:hypothetical protein
MLAYARDGDARLRHLGVRAVGDDLDRASELAGIDRLLLWSTLVGAMFDPAPSVLELSLVLIAKAGEVPRELAPVVAERLERLFLDGGRDVRASVVRAAVKWISGQGLASALVEGLVERAESDRSWIVRDASRAAAKES